MKRFYKEVGYQKEEDGYRILLDQKPLKTPAGQVLLVQNEALALLAAEEWQGQEDTIRPQNMPVTQYLVTCQDRTACVRREIEVELMRYLDTDLICYPAPAPPELVRIQDESWPRWRSWFEGVSGATLEVTTGIKALTQSKDASDYLAQILSEMEDLPLTLLQNITAASGSIILSLAFMKGKIDPQTLIEAISTEDRHKAAIYDADKYGPDPDTDKKYRALRFDFEAAEKILKAIHS